MKKYLIIFFTLIYCLVGYSQPPIIDKLNDKFKEYDYYAKPSTTSDLTTFFKRHIDTDLLSRVKPKFRYDFQKRTFLTFKLNNNVATDIKVNTGSSKLDKMFIKAFKTYNIEILNIKDKSYLNLYSIQLTSWLNNESILNCSQYVIINKLPVYDGCQSVRSYDEMRKCIDKKLENHIINNISLAELEKANIKGQLILYPKFLINNNGSLSKIRVKTESNELSKEINRVIALFPKPISPPMRNGNTTGLFYQGSVNLFIDALNEVTPNLSTENELALHFKKYLSDKELQEIPIHKTIFLTFSIDKRGKAVEVKTSNYNTDINSDDKLVSIFKKFPLEKLNINSKSILEQYTFPILNKPNHKTIIECSNGPIVRRFPILNGCENSKTQSDLRKCFHQKIGVYVSKKFNLNSLKETKIKGKVSFKFRFRVDAGGSINDIEVIPSNLLFAKIATEAEKILKDFPKAISPGYKNGKPVIIPYSFPFTVINE